MITEVWVFNGEKTAFASGIFLDKALAEGWILENKLSGVLTLYPVNTGVYQWAIGKGFFTPKKCSQLEASFIGSFTTASQEHYHYENGVSD